jgi:hypothetical protein
MKSHDRPYAAKGFTSYRCKTPYGYVMIGAKDHDDAMRESQRSSGHCKRKDLEVWDGSRYAPC